MTRNLTEGTPWKVILGFAGPIFMGLLLQQIYSMADAVIVGRFVGVNALGGVGSTGSLNFLILGSCIGLCMGFAVPVSNAFGAGDYSLLRRYVVHGCYLCVAIGAVVMAVVLTNCGAILHAMHTPEETYGYAFDYIYIMFWGIPAVMLYNMTSAVIRAMGDSKSPLLFLGIAAFINVVLDLVFIIVLDFGVAGAAWATNLSQGVSGLLCVVYMRKKLPILRLQPGESRFAPSYCGNLLNNGIPMAMQYFITAIGVVVLQSAINSLGTMYVNAIAASDKINQILACATDALGTTMANFVGQNTGARKLGRIRSGLRAVYVLSAIYSAIALAIAWFFTPALSALFLDPSETELIALVRQCLLVYSAFFWALGLVNGVRFSVQGMGFSHLAIFSGVMELIARVGAAKLLVPAIGFLGACLGRSIAWVMADLFLLPTAYLCLRKLEKRMTVQG